MKKNNKLKGMQWEKKVEKCIASGALHFDKGDLKTEDYVIEVKYTDKKSYRITAKTLEKIWNDALESNKLPKMVIGLQGEENTRWVVTVNLTKEVK